MYSIPVVNLWEEVNNMANYEIRLGVNSAGGEGDMSPQIEDGASTSGGGSGGSPVREVPMNSMGSGGGGGGMPLRIEDGVNGVSGGGGGGDKEPLVAKGTKGPSFETVVVALPTRKSAGAAPQERLRRVA